MPRPQVNVLGLDLSLNATGWARTLAGDIEVGVLRPPNAASDERRRLAWIRLALTRQIAPGAVLPVPWDLIVIEDLPQGGSGRFAGSMQGLGGVHAIVKLILCDADTDATFVNQSTLKMFATGKGTSKKEVVFAEARQRLGYEGTSMDEADALWLMHLGLAHLRIRAGLDLTVKLPVLHTRALNGVRWVPAHQ